MGVKSRSGLLFRHQKKTGKHGRKEARSNFRGFADTGPKKGSGLMIQHKKKTGKQSTRSLNNQLKNKEKKYKCLPM